MRFGDKERSVENASIYENVILKRRKKNKMARKSRKVNRCKK